MQRETLIKYVMESNFTEEQSLSVISEMIEQARNNLQKGSGNAMIFNGCMVAFVALLNIVLIFTLPNPYASFHIWWLMAPVWLIDRMINKRQEKNAVVRTHIDKIISTIWSGFGITTALFLIVIFGYGIAQHNPRIFILITPIIMLMCGLAEFITAKACRFKPFLIGALVMWGGALACLATYLVWPNWSGVFHFFILAVCMLSAFTVPGYQLNKLAKNHV